MDQFAELKQYNQWGLYKLVPSKKQAGKMDKIPLDAKTLKAASSTDPATWCDYQTAEAAARLTGHGIAFFLSEQDPFYLLDVDSCVLPDGSLSEIAQRLVTQLRGASVEWSSSGKGLHVIGKCDQALDHTCRDDSFGLEFYTAGRFVAMTFNVMQDGSVSHDSTEQLAPVIEYHFTPDPLLQAAEWTSEPVKQWNGPEDDQELIKRAKRSGNPFSKGARFADLWDANADALAKAYPTNQDGKEWNYSSADMALAQHLAFWTGKDCERIKRLMLQSALYRDKWEREKYLFDTVNKAVARQVDVLGEIKTLDIVDADDSQPEMVTGHQIMGPDQQMEYFAGCVYVVDLNRIFTPSGDLLTQDRFKALYGGYRFILDNGGSGKDTTNAWIAFTESQAIRWPKANGIEFDPLRPSGGLFTRSGRTMVNTWVDVPVRRVKGDPAPFLDHLQRIIPDDRDRAILLAYMAALVQHQGIKFQWTPLIQGVEGNGKSLLSYCVMQAIGERYCHTPSPEHLDKNFNAWLVGKTFFPVEDIYIPEKKAHVWETLKPMITGKHGIQVEFKGVDAGMWRVVGNFMLNTNHKDAVRKTRGDRRVAPFFCPQQAPEDLARDGMDGDYFPRLYDWLDNHDGYAIMAEYLWTYRIPAELNPAGQLHRAPQTSSTEEMIEASAGRIEQEVLEAIDEQRPGFAGGFVSSYALDKLLARVRADYLVPRNKRTDMMGSLGYVLHPALKGGRLSRSSQCDDGTRPRIYVKSDTIQHNLTAEQAAEQYQRAQTEAIGSTSPAAGAFG